LEGSVKRGALGVLGNEVAQDRLLHYLRGGRIHPAAILAGPEGTGKLAAAKNIAKFLLCRSKKNNQPFCSQCSPCRRIEKDLHPDVLLCRDESEETIKIDTIRQFCHQMDLSPVEGDVKICIVHECHRMSVASSNAFLKTLEEPGEGRYFWLLTSQMGSLLPTILSRCLKFSFKPLVETLSTDRSETFETLWKEFLTSRHPAALVAGLEKKEQCLDFLNFLEKQLRNAALSPYLSESSPNLFQGLTPYEAMDKFEACLKLEGRLRSNANYALMLESFLNRNFIESAA
jgi:DNA polymerase III delta prime subunit